MYRAIVFHSVIVASHTCAPLYNASFGNTFCIVLNNESTVQECDASKV